MYAHLVHREGLEPAPWCDLVSVVQYPDIDPELAMAFGDAFSLDEGGALKLADFAKRCGVNRALLKKGAARMAELATEQAPLQAQAVEYLDDERAFANQLRDFIVGQASRLTALASEAAKVKDEFR